MERTCNLGHGWFATQKVWGDGKEEITIRNCDKGLRIDLPNDSVKTLRQIFATHTQS